MMFLARFSLGIFSRAWKLNKVGGWEFIKEKQESKKKIKHAFDQRKRPRKKEKKTRYRPRKRSRKNKKK